MNPPPLPVRKRFPWILYGIALVLIVGFAFASVGSVMLCAGIANAYGCKVDEGSVHPCIIQWPRLWRASLRSRSAGLADACYSSRRRISFHLLADRAHPPSCNLAKTRRD